MKRDLENLEKELRQGGREFLSEEGADIGRKLEPAMGMLNGWGSGVPWARFDKHRAASISDGRREQVGRAQRLELLIKRAL